MLLNRPTLIFAVLTLAGAAHAQLQFATGFESPPYTLNASALGVYGWTGGAFTGGGTGQTVTNDFASDGSQSLRFAPTGTGGLRNDFVFGLTGKFTLTADVRLAAGSGAGRMAALRLIHGNPAYQTVLSLDGSGAVRASSANQGALGSVVGFANQGTFTDRFLRFTLAYDPLAGKTDWKIGNFGSGQADLGGTFNYDLDSVYLQIESRANVQAANSNGTVWFDNIRVVGPNPVPEPASMVALGLGAIGVVARRRRS